jgi:hypothetical protein
MSQNQINIRAQRARFYPLEQIHNEKLHGLEKANGAKIIYGHDMDLFQTLKKAPEYYI